MTLNLKNEKTNQLIHELADLTGESLTGAVTKAVQERLDRIRKTRDRDLSRRLLAIGADCASGMKEPFRSEDHGELLYDEKGLPR
jgi:antitoxin VapB